MWIVGDTCETSVDWDDWGEIAHKDIVAPEPPEPAPPPPRWFAYYAAAIIAVVIVIKKL